MSAREEYQAHVGGILTSVFQREGQSLVVDPTELNTPLCKVIDAEEGGVKRVTPDWLPSDLQDLRHKEEDELIYIIIELIKERDERRLATLHALLDFLFADGPDPVKVCERIFIVARTMSPDHVWRMSQTEAAKLLGQLKQNFQIMERRVIEQFLSRYSRTEFTTAGGKSASARRKYSAQKRGNTSRRTGRRKGDLPK